MSFSFSILKGAHYKNSFIYHMLTNIRLFNRRIERYKLACQYVSEKDTVLDLCSGTGKLQDFLPPDCQYIGLEASDAFLHHLKKRRCITVKANLHKEIEGVLPKADVAMMIISLYQFRDTSIDRLLEALKYISTKVVIIEEVVNAPSSTKKLRQNIMNFMCTTDFYLDTQLFTVDQFKEVLHTHRYKFSQFNDRYCIGLYEK